jgi:hypothetical protein
LSGAVKKLREFLTYAPSGSSGSASPGAYSFFETSDIALVDVMQLYYRDPTCKSSIDLLAASTVGMGFYTTVDESYAQAAEAKACVDAFCEQVNLDKLLNDMAKNLIACGNDFWLRLSPSKLDDVLRLPIDAVWRVELGQVEGLRLPYKPTGYRLRALYASSVGAGDKQGVLAPEAVIHWQLNPMVPYGFGVGLLQVLLHTLTVNCERRPAYAAMKAKIERLLPKVVEKYAGPDVIVGLPGAKPEVIKAFEAAIKKRPEEGAWLFHGQKDASVTPVTIDPRAVGFSKYIEQLLDQFYLGCETPLPRLFSTPGFTEASANAALELQNMLIRPVQRYVKRQVEREIFQTILLQNGFDFVKAGIRLNWGSPEQPEMLMADLISAASGNLIRPEEFRKTATKSGWELWEPDPKAAVSPAGASNQNQGNSGSSGGE